ncbi:transposase [Streptomyces sp. NPDC057555]|uniref:transposase n=1 Tax=Streptomyces sp. NPDC057555 TaxID=3346166 RepID=UPI00367FA78C
MLPDELRALVAPLLPPLVRFAAAGRRTAPREERAVFTAVVYVLTSGCAWRHLPETFGVSPATRTAGFLAFLGLAAALTRYKRPAQIAT